MFKSIQLLILVLGTLSFSCISCDKDIDLGDQPEVIDSLITHTELLVEVTGFENLDAEAIMLYPADDHKNFNLIREMYNKYKEGYDIVCASRFVKGGSYKGAPLLKRIIVKLVSFTLTVLTTLPTKDATNGFRLFSKEIVDKFKIESKKGFTFSIELLAKAHRHNYKITELPEQWPVRNYGESKFRYSSIFFYIKWYFYILITSFKNAKKN